MTSPSSSGEGSRPRTPISNRLGDLLGKTTALPPPPTSVDPLDMRPPVSSTAASAATGRSFLAHRRGQLSLPPNIHASEASTEPSPQTSPLPVLRWLTGKRPNSRSPTSSRPPTPSSTNSSQYSALSEALRDDISLPSKPAQAHLPEGFYPSRQLTHHPPFLDNLTRSTLPSASLAALSPTTSTHGGTYDLTPDGASPGFLDRGRRRTSVDTLRSLQERGIHTSAPQRFQESPPNQWNWFQWSNKTNTDKLLSEEDQQRTDQEQREHIDKKYSSPKHPLVFCHGLLGFDSVSIGLSIAPMEVTHWRGIKEVLETAGCEVLITRVPATSSPEERAKVLEKRISEVYPGRQVHLIGHSMGGVDCRYLTTHLTNRKFDVLSITTIASPHHGSSFADHFLGLVGTNGMSSVLGLLDMLPNGGGDGKAFESLTVANMKRFNEETPDVEGVRYFSWGATYQPGLIDTWKYSHGIVLEKEGPNDGLVSVESSKWGNYMGTLENVNHLDLVGWTNVARYQWASIMGREIQFKPATFYLGIADHIARVVEEQDDSGDEESSASAANGEGASRPVEHLHRRRTSGEEREVMAHTLEGDDERRLGHRREKTASEEREVMVESLGGKGRAKKNTGGDVGVMHDGPRQATGVGEHALTGAGDKLTRRTAAGKDVDGRRDV